MPIPGSLPVTTPTGETSTAADVFDDLPSVLLTGGNGDTIELTDVEGFLMLDELGIFGMPPTEARVQQGAGHGGRYLGTRYGSRTFDIKLRVEGSTHAEFRARLRRLADVLDPRLGMGKLSVRYPDLGDADGREISVVYSGNWDGSGSGRTFQTVPFTLQSEEAFFRRSSPVILSWGVGTAKPFLSTTSPFFPVTLAPAQVLGQVQLVNPGDVPAPATWRIKGPGGPATFAPGPDTRGFVINAALDSTDLLFVGEDGTLVDGDGENAYQLFGPAPKLWQIPPGASTVRVEVTNATTDSQVLLQFWPRYLLGA